METKSTTKVVRVKERVYYQACMAAMMSGKGLGEWFEEAVLEKLGREPRLTVQDLDKANLSL